MKRQEMLRMRLDGMTYKAIGHSAGISRQRVQQLLSPSPAIRKFIIEKFGGRCNRCRVLVGKSGHVHHNGDLDMENYNDILNLELLCLGCHRKAHNIVDGIPYPSKKERNERLAKFAIDHPDYTHDAIAKIFYISRVRVTRILQKYYK